MPLEEIMTAGIVVALIFFDSSGVEAKVKPGHSRGEPYFRIMVRVSSLYSSSCFRKISTALIAIGLSQKTGSRGIWPDSIRCFRMKTNFCVRSMANAGTMTLPPRWAVAVISAANSGSGSSFGCARFPYVDSITTRSAVSPSCGPECTTFPGRNDLIAHAPNVAGE